jgi:hypothetical protein
MRPCQERRKRLALLFTPTVGYQSDEDQKEKRMNFKREKRKEGEDGGGGRVKEWQPVSPARGLTGFVITREM